MTSCWPTFGTRIGLRAGVGLRKKKNVSGHILFNVLLQRVTKPSDWSCAAPVKKTSIDSTLLFSGVSGLCHEKQRKKKKTQKHLSR